MLLVLLTLPTHYAKQGLCNGRASVRLSVCQSAFLSRHSTSAAAWRAAGLLLSAPPAGHIDRLRRTPAPNSNGAAARPSAANADSRVDP